MGAERGLMGAQRVGQVSETEAVFSSGPGPRHPDDDDQADAPPVAQDKRVSRRSYLVGALLVASILAILLLLKLL